MHVLIATGTLDQSTLDAMNLAFEVRKAKLQDFLGAHGQHWGRGGRQWVPDDELPEVGAPAPPRGADHVVKGINHTIAKEKANRRRLNRRRNKVSQMDDLWNSGVEVRAQWQANVWTRI